MTSTSTKKPVHRTARYDAGAGVLVLTVGALRTRYYLTNVESDAGPCYHLEKLDGSGSVYLVTLDMARGFRHACSCKGASYAGHCKHSEALYQLTKAGKLPSAPAGF